MPNINALEEICLTIMQTLPEPQETDEKDNTERFLFHYSKTRKSGSSNVVSSVLHLLPQLVPQLHKRRLYTWTSPDGQHQNQIDYSLQSEMEKIYAAAAAAKSLQSCPPLCDTKDGSPPGFPIPGILQARTLEWVAISFSNG